MATLPNILCIGFVILFQDVTGFWEDDCDIILGDGCTCYNSTHHPLIDCSNLDLDQVPSFCDVNTTELIDLDMSGNSIQVLTTNTFCNLRLRELIVSNNQRELPISTSENTLTSSQNLLLTSLTMCNDRLIDIPMIVKFLENLLYLDLSQNNIIHLESDILGRLFVLKELDMSGNPLWYIGEHALLGLYSLEVLRITFSNDSSEHADIGELIGSWHMDRLEDMLHELSIQHTVVKNIRFLKSFIALESLQLTHCSLTNRAISRHGSYVLQGSGDTLYHVDLSYNKMTKFYIFVFSSCLNIEYIDLSHNKIVSLHQDSDRSTVFDKLTYLDLSYNVLTEVTANDFMMTPALRQLDLSENHIQSLGMDFLKRMPHLEFLDLSQNRITVIEDWVFPRAFPRGLIISLRNNQLVCDCRTKWLAEAIYEQSISGIGSFDWYEVYSLLCSQGHTGGLVNTILEVYTDDESIIFSSCP